MANPPKPHEVIREGYFIYKQDGWESLQNSYRIQVNFQIYLKLKKDWILIWKDQNSVQVFMVKYKI